VSPLPYLPLIRRVLSPPRLLPARQTALQCPFKRPFGLQNEKGAQKAEASPSRPPSSDTSHAAGPSIKTPNQPAVPSPVSAPLRAWRGWVFFCRKKNR